MTKKNKTNKTVKKDISKLSFEQALTSLNEVVEHIEQGDISLADSIEKYEKGMGLIRHCRSILQEAEKRIEKIADDKESQPEDDIDHEDSDFEEDQELF